MAIPRVEVITSVERRRRWSRAEKERLVAASLEPGVTASEVARSAGVHVSQLFRWRKQLCTRIDAAPAPQALVPVRVVPDEGSAGPEPRRRRRRSRPGVIEIEAAGGRRVRISGEVDVETLRCVLDLLERR